jgi:hypothetical protein
MTARQEQILFALAALADDEVEPYVDTLSPEEREFALDLLFSDKYIDPEVVEQLDALGEMIRDIHIRTIDPDQLN